MRALTFGMAAVGLSLIGGAAAAQAPEAKWGDGGVSAFYTWTGPLPDRPGVMLRAEPLPAALMLANAAAGERILYTSTDGVTGTGVISVSGVLYLPKGAPPKGGWPLIAWAHGTVGMADVCAPSWAGRSDRDVRYLNTWLANGFAVVATDYQGLGTPGPHPYIETRPEAYSVLDSVRAVEGRAQLSHKVVIVGQSQGAGAAFATAALAARYAPDVDVRATVATGTPNLSAATLATASNNDFDRVDPTIAYVFYLTLTVQQTRPEIRGSDIFTDRALPLFETAQNQCVGPLFKAVINAGLTRRTAVKPEGLAKVFGPLLPALGYATLKLEGPVFMGAGAEDKDVNPKQQMALAKAACDAGTVVEAHLYAGLDHSGAVNGSLRDSLPFVRKALAGEPITPRCTAEPELPAP
jgi:pimeloyl-ACP methyl ester carboxylesterase